ncbi:MAG: hypothetical protein ACRCXK_01030 [Wohlfahrtiimonas sp.]
MKNNWITLLVFCVTNGFFSMPSYAESPENLPENIVEFYKIKPLSINSDDQNLYIWGIGFNYPKDNYYAIGQQIAKANYQLGESMKADQLGEWDTQQRIQHIHDYLDQGEELLKFNNPFASNGSKRINACNRYDDKKCIQKTIENAAEIEQLTKMNQVIRERYESIPYTMNKSIGYFHPYSFADAAYPDIASILNIIDLYAANAVIDFSRGEKTKGFERLERIRFFVDMSHEGTLTLPLIQLNIQQALNQTINALLNAKLIEPNDPFLSQLYSQDIDRFDHRIRQALKWQAKTLMQNNLYLYQDYKNKLIDVMKDEMIDLEDERNVAIFLYDYYKTYEDSLNQAIIDSKLFQQVTPHIEGLPFNVSLSSPYEYLMQAKYQKAYEQLLRAKIKVLKGEALEPQDNVQLDQKNSMLYISFEEKLEEGSPLLPQSIRWFNQGRQFLGRLEVAIPEVK